MNIQEKLIKVEEIVNAGVTSEDVSNILEILGCPFPTEILEEIKLYSDYLPVTEDVHYTKEKKYLHFLWDILDKLPISVVSNFAIPFRRILAKRLFKRCGKNFIAEENVRFNIPDNIEIGDDVFLNRGVFLDSKGGIELGNSVCLTEAVMIFTHSHSESDHSERTYNKVVIKDFAKVYTNSTILPGVTLGEGAIIASGAIVNKDIAPGILAAGIPAKPLRERKTNGRINKELNHIWLHNKAFQHQF